MKFNNKFASVMPPQYMLQLGRKISPLKFKALSNDLSLESTNFLKSHCSLELSLLTTSDDDVKINMQIYFY